jgi:hypothetical protein
LGATELIKGSNELGMQLRQPAAPNFACLLLLLRLGLEAKHRGS